MFAPIGMKSAIGHLDQAGHGDGFLMLRKLGSYPRQNGLAVALRELGRIERTLFILDWLQSVELRRRVHAGLNKGEARNAWPAPCSSTAWAKFVTAVLSSSATGPAAST
jgi:hypothetical protein